MHDIAFAKYLVYLVHMPEDPENLTLRILQELRQEMQEMRRDLTARVDGLTVMVGMVIGMVKDHEERIEKLETR